MKPTSGRAAARSAGPTPWKSCAPSWRRQAARGELDTAGSLNSFDIAAAVRTFIGAAGVLPHMGATLAHASAAQRQEIWQYVDMVATWVDGAQQALRTVAVPFADEQGV